MADLIARLFPFDDEKHKFVKALIHDERDTDRFVPNEIERQPPGRWSRETTAALEEDENETNNLKEMSSLQLRFDDSSYRNGKGIMFGWHPTKCDIVLPKLERISREHCYLTYGENNRLVLKDVSSFGTIVKYDGKGGRKKKHFTWILGGDDSTDDKKVITIEIQKHVKFQIVVPKHNVFSYAYVDNVAAFKAQMEELKSLPLGHMDIESRTNTLQAGSRDEAEPQAVALAESSSGPDNPLLTSDSIVLTRKHLGNGSYGSVDHMWDVSTGNEYARKYFRDSTTFDWVDEAKKMKNLEHPNIVQLKAVLTDGPSPGIYLDFVPLGTLEHQWRQDPFSVSELEQTLLQGSSALEYLHRQRVVHRDIKPENILVESRAPWHIKLADFGLSKAGESLYTFCGTALYAAPEILALQSQSRSQRQSYTAAVDIWSLGVVILAYGYGLPRYPKTGALLLDWPEKLVRTLDAWDPDGFDVLYNMLVLDPQRRASASSCLEQIRGDSALRPGWTAVNNGQAGGYVTYAADEEEATQVFDYGATQHNHATLTPYGRKPSRQQWGSRKDSVSIHESEIDAYIKTYPLTAGRSLTGVSAQDLDANGSDDVLRIQQRAHVTGPRMSDLAARTYVKKRPKSSRSTPSITVPSDRRPRQRKRHSDADSVRSRYSTHPGSPLALFGEGWLKDPNCVGSSVAAMGQSSDSDWSCWTGDNHAAVPTEHLARGQYPNDCSNLDHSGPTPSVEQFLYLVQNAIGDTSQC